MKYPPPKLFYAQWKHPDTGEVFWNICTNRDGAITMLREQCRYFERKPVEDEIEVYLYGSPHRHEI